MSESADARPRDEALEERLANRRSPGDPDYDAFYDATDAELAAMVPRRVSRTAPTRQE